MKNPSSKFSLFVAFATALAALSSPARAQNLLKNGGFAAVKDGAPAEWNFSGTKQTISADPAEKTGASKQSLRVDVVTDGGGSLGEIVQKVAVTPGKRYEFAVDIKSSESYRALGEVKLFEGGRETGRVQTDRSTDGWKRVSVDFDAGKADLAWVDLRYDQLGRNVGQKMWFANASLTEIAPAPPVPTSADAPLAVPTYEAVGLYWKPASGAADNACAVSYRAAGEKGWREALPLWFDATEHPGLEEHSLEYRGSIVNLKPGTSYEIKLRLAKDGAEKLVKVTTWSDKFKVAKTVTLTKETPQPYVIDEGGSEETGYVVYDCAPGVVLDGKGAAEENIKVNASHVILRGLTMKDAKVNGVLLGNVQDVVIEDCDVSGWGRVAEDGWGVDLDSALYSRSRALTRITIQGCRLHNPRSNSNSWTEERVDGGHKTKHPLGPQTISFFGSQGRLVIRRNKIYTDPQHKYNDSMGEVENFSFGGFPNRDSDVYENDVSGTYDDGIEMEGADMNVRVWGNRFDDIYGSVGCATSSLGPIYIYRNVMNSSRKGPAKDADGNKGAYLVKLGNENETFTKGRIFVFHNTMLQPPPRDGFAETSGGNSGIGTTAPTKHQSNVTSRNNILFLRDDKHTAIRDYFKDPTNDYDYDLYYGTIAAGDGAESHGIKAKPDYDTTVAGKFPLKQGTPGVDAGVRIPNFNDDFSGKAPDMGAFESK